MKYKLLLLRTICSFVVAIVNFHVHIVVPQFFFLVSAYHLENLGSATVVGEYLFRRFPRA